MIESELRNSEANMTQQFLTALAQDGALDTEAMVGEQLINMYGELTGQINESSDRQVILGNNSLTLNFNLSILGITLGQFTAMFSRVPATTKVWCG